MKRRIIAALMLVGSFSGCISTNEPEMGGPRPNYGRSFGPPTVPGVMGPHGENVPMAPPYNMAPPGSQLAAMRMMNNSMPMNMLNTHPTGIITPPGMQMPGTSPMPGVPGPGGAPAMPGAGNPFMKTSMTNMMPNGGVMNANIPPGMRGPGGLAQAQFAASPSGPLFPAQRTQVFFTEPAGMKIFWVSHGADGKPNTSATPLETPGRFNFAQAAIYRLKLEKIPGRFGLELYPTLEVVPSNPKTSEFLAHNSVPVEFTDKDFNYVRDKNYIVKVIYLPDAQFQEGGAGPMGISSVELDAGQDPIQEALRRGSILLVLRMGNIDQGLQHSPSMTAPVPGGPTLPTKPPGLGVPPLMQIPFPTPALTPGGSGSIPNPLPPLPGSNPEVGSAPKLPAPPEVKIDVNDKKGDKLVVPPITLPAPPGAIGNEAIKPLPEIPLPPKVQPKNAGPALPPAPNPAIKNDKGVSTPSVLPTMPVIPTSSSKETGPQLPSVTLPTLPAVDGGRTDLPLIPMLPGGDKR